MKFETQGSETVTHKDETFAKTPREAARQYFDKRGHWPETVVELAEDEADQIVHEIVSACEGCVQAIFEGEKYYSGDDADVCEKCGDEMKAETAP